MHGFFVSIFLLKFCLDFCLDFGSKKFLPEGPGKIWEAFWSLIGRKTLNFQVEISRFSAFF